MAVKFIHVFQKQEKIKTFKTIIISEVIDFAESYIQNKLSWKKRIQYNIETKSDPKGDDMYSILSQKNFVDLLVNVLNEKGIKDRVYIQSFDVRTLQYLHSNYPDFKTVLLIENKMSIAKNLKILGFTPNVYSPEFILLSKKKVNQLHQKNIKVIPWTINQEEDMKRIIDFGVDGIITDYPDRYFELLK